MRIQPSGTPNAHVVYLFPPHSGRKFRFDKRIQRGIPIEILIRMVPTNFNRFIGRKPQGNIEADQRGKRVPDSADFVHFDLCPSSSLRFLPCRRMLVPRFSECPAALDADHPSRKTSDFSKPPACRPGVFAALDVKRFRESQRGDVVEPNGQFQLFPDVGESQCLVPNIDAGLDFGQQCKGFFVRPFVGFARRFPIPIGSRRQPRHVKVHRERLTRHVQPLHHAVRHHCHRSALPRRQRPNVIRERRPRELLSVHREPFDGNLAVHHRHLKRNRRRNPDQKRRPLPPLHPVRPVAILAPHVRNDEFLAPRVHPERP